MENKIVKFIVGGTITLGFVLIMLFTILNFLLGCESWDQTYWTDYNQCIYPLEFLGMFLPPYGG